MASIVISGDTSGSVTLQAPAVAGSTVLNLPATSGTIQASGAGYTTNGVAYASSATGLATGSALVFDGTTFKAGSLWAQGAQGGELYINLNGTSNNYYNAGTHIFQAASGLSEYMRLTSTGLGIGTTSFSSKFAVSGSGYQGGSLQIIRTDTSSNFALGGTDSGAFQIYDVNSSNATRLLINSTGNVGIGTISPTAKVHAYSGTTMGQMTVDGVGAIKTGINFASGGTTYGQIYFDNNSPYDMSVFQQYSTGSLRFGTNNTERARITSTGNLLVGTTSAGFSNSNGITIQAAEGYCVLNHANGTGSGTNYIWFGYNGGSIGTISQNGTTAVAYNTSSDYRLKNNIAPMTGALEKVALLKPCTYKWNVDNSDGEGFIAHELAEVCPHAVNGEKDAVETYIDEDGNEQTRPVYQGIDTSFLVATLTAAIQEQQALITTLTDRISVLENK